jgi:hypothetical protein
MKNSSVLLRLGAAIALIANVVAGLLFPDHDSLSAPVQPLYVPLNLASVIGATLLLFGLAGWYRGHAGALGRRGVYGLSLVVLTLLLAGVFQGLYQASVFPMAAAQAPALLTPGPALFLALLLLSVLCEIVGPLLLGWDLLKRSIGPRWAATCILVSAPVTAAWFGSVMVDGDAAPSPLTIVGNLLSAALLFVALAGFGAEPAADQLDPRPAAAVPSAL